MFEFLSHIYRRRIEDLERALSECREESREYARQAKVARDDYFQEKNRLMSVETELTQLRYSYASLERNKREIDEIKPYLFEAACAMALAASPSVGRVPRVVDIGHRAHAFLATKALSAIYPEISIDTLDAGVERGDSFFLWGSGPTHENLRLVSSCLSAAGKLYMCEDGLLKSADTWCAQNVPERFKCGCSVVIDDSAYYFDATKPSAVERMLNDQSFVVTEAERDLARKRIGRIVSEKLTKYNHQVMEVPIVGRPRRPKVLVVDQSFGDYAIRKGMADEHTFEKMLSDAIHDNPDADILVKTHPDAMTGVRRGYYDSVQESVGVFRVTMPVNPYSLMEIVDKVYVCSTQFGFEALMAGKEVHVYGMPFYAGWGATIDSQKCERRTNTRTVEEIFHIFYLCYTHWYNPDTMTACTIDDCMDWLLSRREEYRRWKETHNV